jgi:hypothetical protein
VAVSWVAETKVVVRGVPLTFTLAPDKKFVPVTAMEAAEVLALSDEGETLVTVGAGLVTLPAPLRGTLCGLPLALSARVRVPDRVPTAVGVKVTLITQLPPAATGVLVLQVVPLTATAKSPVTAMLVKVKDPVPVLVTVTGLAALVVPTN